MRFEAIHRPVFSGRSLLRFLLVTLALAATSPANADIDWQTAFRDIRSDPRPPALTRGAHYLVTDERRHDLFHDTLVGVGGVFLGVGTDQNYLMAGWARAEALVLLDFDQMVVDIHDFYRLAFLHAATPAEFVELWSDKSRKRLLALGQEAWGETSEWRRRKRALEVARELPYLRLKRCRDELAKLGIPSFLDDQAQYDHLVRLFREGRVFAVRGDLTADRTMKDVAAALRRVGATIRVYYPSNAEQYFKYRGGYRDNVLALPFDEKTIVLRTIAKTSAPSVDGRYHYFVQRGRDLQGWLEARQVDSVWGFWRRRIKTDVFGLYELPPPPTSDSAQAEE